MSTIEKARLTAGLKYPWTMRGGVGPHSQSRWNLVCRCLRHGQVRGGSKLTSPFSPDELHQLLTRSNPVLPEGRKLSKIEADDRQDLLALTTDIVSAHVAHNIVSINDLPSLIGSVHATLAGLGSSTAEEPVELKPAVPVKSSIKPDYIVCLEDGVKLKMLKRHLMTHHGLAPEAYRARWSLPANYPMVSPNYSAARSALAVSIGLGRKKPSDSPVETSASSSAARLKMPGAPPVKRPAPRSPGRRKLGIFTKDD